MESKTSDRFNPKELHHFRAKLNAQRNHIAETEDDVESEALAGFSEESTDELSSIRTHPADLADNEMEQDVDLTLAEGEIDELQEIDDALARINADTYGVCEECGEEIPRARLEAVPYTRFCAACERKREARGSVSS